MRHLTKRSDKKLAILLAAPCARVYTLVMRSTTAALAILALSSLSACLTEVDVEVLPCSASETGDGSQELFILKDAEGILVGTLLLSPEDVPGEGEDIFEALSESELLLKSLEFETAIPIGQGSTFWLGEDGRTHGDLVAPNTRPVRYWGSKCNGVGWADAYPFFVDSASVCGQLLGTYYTFWSSSVSGSMDYLYEVSDTGPLYIIPQDDELLPELVGSNAFSSQETQEDEGCTPMAGEAEQLCGRPAFRSSTRRQYTPPFTAFAVQPAP